MLAPEIVLEIRDRYDAGFPVSEIAAGYRVSQTTVSNIGLRRTHKRVKRLNRRLPPYPSAKHPRKPSNEGKAERATQNLRR